jgi:hypothetical protein
MSATYKVGICLAFAVLAAPPGYAATKINAACIYESGQNGPKTISDFSIWNTASFDIPKGTLVTFSSTGAPGKVFTTKAPKNIAPNDTFSSGGTIPMGSCTAFWLK